ncbi:uncharacterized protein [Leuresthes tenuis]|uniref:uncharacterized protein n=1 Tax=Leuresthes tenuis TaxID=355514 RepID=UPI003B505F37
MNCLVLPFLLVLLRSGFGSLPAPVNVSISSVNFHHVLHWDPGPGTPPGTVYKPLKRVSGHELNLNNKSTSKTSIQLKLKNKKIYYISVLAFYNQTQSPPSKRIRFTPWSDTKIGPPNVTIAGSDTSIQVNISLPQPHRYSEIVDIQAFYDINFRVLWRKEAGRVEEFETRNKSVTITNLDNGVKHCIQVDIKSRVNKNTEPSAWFCTVTGTVRPTRGLIVMRAVSPLVIIVIILVMMGMFSLCYTGVLWTFKPAVPRSLMTVLCQSYILTPDRMIPDPISISSEIRKKKKRKDPQTYSLFNTNSDSEEEGHSEKEEDVKHLYLDRDGGYSLAGSSHEDSVMFEQSKLAVSEDFGRVMECLSAETPESDEDDAKAEGAGMPVMNSLEQVGVKAQVRGAEDKELKEEDILDTFGDVNLFSVTLASLPVGNEVDEEEEGQTKDSFPHLPSLKRTESDYPTPVQLENHNEDNTETQYDCRCESYEEEEEEEEEEEDEDEEFSGYLGHR